MKAVTHNDLTPGAPPRIGARQLPTQRRLSTALWATRGQFLALGGLAGVWGVHIPSVKRAFGLGELALSMVLLAIALGAVVALLLAGRVVGQWGTRRVAWQAALAMGALLALSLHWPGLVTLLLAMVGFGAAMSLFDVAINTEGSALEQTLGRPVMGNLHGHFSLGAMLGAVAAGAMIGAGVAAVWQLAVAGLVVALGALGAARGMLPDVADTAHAQGVNGLARFVWPRGRLLVLGLLAFAGMSAEGAMVDWSVLYLQQGVGMAQADAAWGFAAFSAAMACARFGGDQLRQRWAEAVLLRRGASLAAMALLTLLVVAEPWVALPAYVCIGAGLAMVVPILYNAASCLPGQHRASAIAAVSVIGYAGFLLGPPIIGSVAQASTLSWGLGLVVPILLLLAWGARNVASRAHHPGCVSDTQR